MFCHFPRKAATRDGAAWGPAGLSPGTLEGPLWTGSLPGGPEVWGSPSLWDFEEEMVEGVRARLQTPSNHL